MQKIGDKREYKLCPTCGEMQYEIYSSRASYGQGLWRGWVAVVHHNVGDCIQKLKDRIAELSAR